MALPAKLNLELRLDTEIDTGSAATESAAIGSAAVGSEVRATLLKPAGPLPEGAKFTGSILKIERHPDSSPWCDVLIEWSRAESQGTRYRLSARLVDFDSFPAFRRGGLSQSLYGSEAPSGIAVKGAKGSIPAGLRMRWRTEDWH